MQQVKFSLTPAQLSLLRAHKEYGFKDMSSMVRAALAGLQAEIELEQLRESADLYAAVYDSDVDLATLAEGAIWNWPA